MPDKDPYDEITIVIIAGIIIFLVLSAMVIFILLFYQKKKFQHSQQLTDMQNQFQQELLQTQLEIQEQTFHNISQELHDNIGQALSFIKLSINTINIDARDTAIEKLFESKNLLTQVIQDLRDLSKTLNTDFISDIGLSNAVQQQLNMLQKSGIYNTQLTVNGEPYKYQMQRELVLFRIVQELLNNIVKHADATSININMNYQKEKLQITVYDNGKGFDTKQLSLNTNKGLGLRNMINRMKLIDGYINITSAPGNGTTAIIELPKPKIPEDDLIKT